MSGINLDGFLDIASTGGPPPHQENHSIPQHNGDSSSSSSSALTTKPNKRKKGMMNAQREFILKDWLASLQLGEYYNVLYEEGYDKPLSLKVLTDEELVELGIKKKGHRIILLNAIKDEYFTSLTASSSYHGSSQFTQPMQRLTHVPHQPHYEPPPLTYHQPIQQQPAPPQQPPNQKTRTSPGQLVPMGFAHSDSPTSDDEMDDNESTNGLSNSSDIPIEQHAPQSPNIPHKSAPLRNSQSQSQPNLHYQSPPLPPLPPRPLSPSQAYSRIPLQRYQDEYDEDEDEDDASPPPLSTRLPSPPPQPHPSVKIRINSKTEQPSSSSPPHKPSSSQSTTSTTTTTSSTSALSEPHKPSRKRSRSAEKPEQANPDPDAPPKPKPAAITFIPKQHYSRSDIHDCLGGQRFCAISTPSAYPFILIFAHYQAYVGEDGMWEQVASGDLNKGVNRGVIHAKEKKKRLLLFFSMAGQQGAVLFLGEVKYVSSEQREEKNSKGVDKACVVFKFQRINNDAITINLFDFTKPEAIASQQPKPVIRSLTEDPNTYYLDSTYSSNFSETNPNPSANASHNINNNNNINTLLNTTNNNNMRRSLANSSTSLDGKSSSDAIPIIPIASPSSSPHLSATPSSSSSSSQHPLIPIKKESAKEGDHVPPNNPTSSTSSINLSRTSISKIINEGALPASITRISTVEEKGEKKAEDGWAFTTTNSVPIIPTTSIITINDTRVTEKPDSTPTSTTENNNNTRNTSTYNNYNNEREALACKDDFVVPSTTSIPANEPAAMDTN